MSDAAAFWNPRFAVEEYVYGTEPNDFLRQQAGRFGKGAKVLSLGEGEGRNAVFLAGLGHQVTAVDASEAGLAKVAKLAASKQLLVETVQADLADYVIAPKQWDVIVAIFCHLPQELAHRVFGQAVAGLKPGGLLVLEGYTPRQLAFGTGGPKDAALLYEPEVIRHEIAGLELLHFAELERPVLEGKLHTGQAAVLQVVAQKPLAAMPAVEAGEGYLRHLDGGYYRRLGMARHSEDESEMVVYAHLWPFEPHTWVRPAAEFPGRFEPVTEAEVLQAMQGDQAAAAAAVMAAKAARRAKKG
ncbi:DUF1653 domain-containing protein [Leeia oryzae]|uniref:DUF1653 domain-containing protein n=1 Tax=Leeia oryzae TaxID=356662 RepID=UPI000370CE8C|nr:DUF1653 domain-containing protein [Leeia oryzae]